jgi:radical SAM protein with 4Fe4S-binding SPASM domain
VDVWRNAAMLETMRGRVDIPLRSFEGCRDCEYAALCTGNCPGTAFSRLGNVNEPSPDACLRLFKSQLAEEGLSLW